VTVDCFEAPCFVVEDRHGLHEEIGSNARHLWNGVTLVKPKAETWSDEL